MVIDVKRWRNPPEERMSLEEALEKVTEQPTIIEGKRPSSRPPWYTPGLELDEPGTKDKGFIPDPSFMLLPFKGAEPTLDPEDKILDFLDRSSEDDKEVKEQPDSILLKLLKRRTNIRLK